MEAGRENGTHHFGPTRPIARRGEPRPNVLNVFLVNGGAVRIPKVTDIQIDQAAGALNVRCRNGNVDVAAFNANHIVGWLIEEPETDSKTPKGRSNQGETGFASGHTALPENARVTAIREALGNGLSPLLADDEERFRVEGQ